MRGRYLPKRLLEQFRRFSTFFVLPVHSTTIKLFNGQVGGSRPEAFSQPASSPLLDKYTRQTFVDMASRAMALRRRLRRGRGQKATTATEDVRGAGVDGFKSRNNTKPLGKIMLRFRPLLQDEVNLGEKLCVTARGYVT